jgi:hypothetical protein
LICRKRLGVIAINRIEGSELQAWTNILPWTLYSCPLNMILVCWYGVDFQKWCSSHWCFYSEILILQCIFSVCWGTSYVKLTTSRTVWLIWWFLNTLIWWWILLITFNIWQFVSYFIHPGFKDTKLTRLHGPLMLIWSLYGELLIWSGLWNLPLHILVAFTHLMVGLLIWHYGIFN